MKEYLKSLKIIHIALSVGVASFIAIVYFLQTIGGLGIYDETLSSVFMILVPLTAFISPSVGVLLFNKSMKEMKVNDYSLEEKKQNHKSAYIVKLALIEGAAFFAIVAFMLITDYVFLIMAGVVLIFLIIQHPTDYRLSEDFDIDPKEFL